MILKKISLSEKQNIHVELKMQTTKKSLFFIDKFSYST